MLRPFSRKEMPPLSRPVSASTSRNVKPRFSRAARSKSPSFVLRADGLRGHWDFFFLVERFILSPWVKGAPD